MTCFECGEGNLVEGKVTLASKRNGDSVTVEMMGYRCDKCGFQTVDSKQSAQLTQLVSDAYRRAHQLLTGKEIRNRRSRLGMTQKSFADYIGVGIASVKRWELGQIQDRAMDQLIRLKTDPQCARQNLETVERQSSDHRYILSAVLSYGSQPPMALEGGEVGGLDDIFDDSAVCAA